MTAVENCAESATTVTPQTRASASVTAGGPPNVSPIVAAQSALAAMAAIVAAVRPQRSETTPPSQQPSAPIAMTTNVAVLGARPAYPVAAAARALSKRNRPIQAHIA